MIAAVDTKDLEELYDEGVLRSLGVSNFNLDDLMLSRGWSCWAFRASWHWHVGAYDYHDVLFKDGVVKSSIATHHITVSQNISYDIISDGIMEFHTIMNCHNSIALLMTHRL